MDYIGYDLDFIGGKHGIVLGLVSSLNKNLKQCSVHGIKMSRVLISGLEDLCLHPTSAVTKLCDLEQVPFSMIFGFLIYKMDIQ